MPPIVLLGLLIAGTAAAVVVNRWTGRRQQLAYAKLAVEHRMHFSPNDPLRLTARVAPQLPVRGAAGVRLIDLLYRTDDQHHYYVFTAEYTIGVLGPKKRIRRAAAFTESKRAAGEFSSVTLGPEHLPLIEQYQILISNNKI